jgi:peptidoglycan/LPS O-acetylase OafA/YrhL
VAKWFVVAIWMAVVLLLAGLLFVIHLPALGVALIVFEFAMGVAIAVWRSDRKRAEADGSAPPPAGRPRLGTPLDPLVRTPRRERRRAADQR